MWMEMAPWLWGGIHARHVAIREDGKHAWRSFGRSGVDRRGSTVRDRAVNDSRMCEVFDRNVRRVARCAGYLKPAVDARERLSNCTHTRAPATSSARNTTRCASSILKAF